jgi:hypothetical protein
MSDAIQTRGIALLHRLSQLDATATNWIPGAALRILVAALEDDDLDGAPYIDMAINRDTAELAGELVVLTAGGVLVGVSFHGDDQVDPVTVRPLRGRVAKIELAYSERLAGTGQMPARAANITLDDATGSVISLPLSRRADGANFLAPIIKALT